MSNLKVLTVAERRARGAVFFDGDPGLTEQSHKDSCDINKIMANYTKTGLVPVYSDQIPQQGDFTSVVDYHTASCVVKAAEQAFDGLPADLRKEYNFDPDLFLKALDDPEQRAKLVKLGVYSESEPLGEAISGSAGGSQPPAASGGSAAPLGDVKA